MVGLVGVPEIIAARDADRLAVLVQIVDDMQQRIFPAIRQPSDMLLDLAETAGEGELRLFRQVLVAEREDVVFQKGVHDGVEHLVVEWRRQVDAPDFDAADRRQRRKRERRRGSDLAGGRGHGVGFLRLFVCRPAYPGNLAIVTAEALCSPPQARPEGPPA